MVTDFLNVHLRQTRRCAGRYRDHGRAKPEAYGVDSGQREEFDDNLCDPWPRRPFLRRKHDSKKISECAVRGKARSNRGDAKAGPQLPLLARIGTPDFHDKSIQRSSLQTNSRKALSNSKGSNL